MKQRNLLVHVMLALGAAAMLWFVLAGAASGLLQGSDGTIPDPTLDTTSLLVGFAAGAVAGALTAGIPAVAKLRSAARKSREKLGGDCQDTGPISSHKAASIEVKSKGWDGTIKGVKKDAADMSRAGPIEDPRYPPTSIPPQQRKILDYGEAGEAITPAGSDGIVPVAMDKGLRARAPQDDAGVKAPAGLKEEKPAKKEFKGHVTLLK